MSKEEITLRVDQKHRELRDPHPSVIPFSKAKGIPLALYRQSLWGHLLFVLFGTAPAVAFVALFHSHHYFNVGLAIGSFSACVSTFAWSFVAPKVVAIEGTNRKNRRIAMQDSEDLTNNE